MNVQKGFEHAHEHAMTKGSNNKTKTFNCKHVIKFQEIIGSKLTACPAAMINGVLTFIANAKPEWACTGFAL